MVERRLEVIDLRPLPLGEVGVRDRGDWRDNNEVERKSVVIPREVVVVGDNNMVLDKLALP